MGKEEVNGTKCEFWNEGRKRCDVRRIRDTYGSSNTPIGKVPNGYYKKICTTKYYGLCMRRIHLKQLIETGAWGD